MQGRLLPKYQGRYQAHPVGYWQKEFGIAKKMGLECIEFILDYNDYRQNPLLKEGGIEEILEVCDSTAVSVAAESRETLTNLLKASSELGVTDIVIPCVDKPSLDNKETVDRFSN
mgnify:CR=1 FL=1